LHSRHRAIEFKQLLATIEREVPAHLDVHVVLENSSAHKTPVIRNWLAAHPRLALHFTPTSSSWLNLVERWFAELANQKLPARRARIRPRPERRHPRLDQDLQRRP
jgi:transposase